MKYILRGPEVTCMDGKSDFNGKKYVHGREYEEDQIPPEMLEDHFKPVGEEKPQGKLEEEESDDEQELS
jgi:hypothetical protein